MGKSILTAKRFRPPAQGCRRGYPGIRNENDYPTARRLRDFFVQSKRAQPRCGWAVNHSRPRVAEAVTVRWKTLTALRFALSSSRLDVSSQIGNNNYLFQRGIISPLAYT